MSDPPTGHLANHTRLATQRLHLGCLDSVRIKDADECEEWERGWGNARGDYEMRGG